MEAVAAEGKSLAHVDGKVLFVPATIPGDVVDVQVTRIRSKHMEGYLTRLVKPSDDRTEPFCSHFDDCGGCSWQMLPYPMQLRFKQQQVEDQLHRIGHLELPGISPILPSPATLHYRNKLEFTFSRNRWILKGEDISSLSEVDRLALGFHVGGFFDKVLDIKECHLQRDPSDAIRNFVRAYAIENGLGFFDLRAHTGFLRNLTLRNTLAGEWMAIVSFGPDAADEIDGARAKREALLDAISQRFPEIISLYYVINPKCNDSIADLSCTLYRGDDALYEVMEDLRFKIGPKSFFQTNPAQAYRLYSVVRDFVVEGKNVEKPLIYDLYTGTGTIALFLASVAEKVVGIEYVPEAIEDARHNAALNSIDNCSFFAGDMKDMLTGSFIEANGRPDVVVLDPPRAGIHPDVIQVLLEAAPDTVVYVSCNPATQARDLAALAVKYRILKVQPVDMFPHTTHVENVVLLKRTAEEDRRDDGV